MSFRTNMCAPARARETMASYRSSFAAICARMHRRAERSGSAAGVLQAGVLQQVRAGGSARARRALSVPRRRMHRHARPIVSFFATTRERPTVRVFVRKPLAWMVSSHIARVWAGRTRAAAVTDRLRIGGWTVCSPGSTTLAAIQFTDGSYVGHLSALRTGHALE